MTLTAVEERGASAPASRRETSARRPARRRRQSGWSIGIAAAMALTTVLVAHEVERSVVDGNAEQPTTAVADRVTQSPEPAAEVGTSAPATAPLRIRSGELELTLDGGSATIADGSGTPVELTTARLAGGPLGTPSADVRDGEAVHRWPGVEEWYRTLDGGFQHGYTIDEPLTDADELEIVVEVDGAQPLAVGDRSAVLVRPDDSVLSYRGLIAFDADGDDLPARMEVGGGTITLTVDTAGADYPITVDPIIGEDQRIDNPTPLAEERFGVALDVDGNRMVVTTLGGDAYVYERPDAASLWALDATISHPGPSPAPSSSTFGASVSILGDQIAIGLPRTGLGFDPDEGPRVFLYTRVSQGDWGSPATIATPPGTDVGGDLFGASLDFIALDLLVIGAPGVREDSGGTGIETGLVYVYNAATPTLFRLDSAFFGGLPQAGDRLGASVDVEPTGGGEYRLVVGAPGSDTISPAQTDSGAVYIVESPIGPSSSSIRLDGFGASAELGSAVDLAADRLAIAGFGPGGVGEGIDVEIFETSDAGVSWTPEASVEVPAPGLPGALADAVVVNDYLDLEGGTLAVGTPGNGGQVALYRYDGFAWSATPLDGFVPTERDPGDRVGRALELDGSTLVVGAPGDGGATNSLTDAGAVYTYELTREVKIFDENAPGADWADPNNWDPSGVPDADDIAIVRSGRQPAVLDDQVVGALRLGGRLEVSGSLTIASAGQVQAGGELAVLAGGVVTAEGSFDVDETGALEFGIDTENDRAGLLSLPGGTFVANGELRAVDVDDAYLDADDRFEIITCGDCYGAPSRGKFDSYALSPFDVVVDATSVGLQLVDNKLVSPDVVGLFGSVLDVDGDRGIVGEPSTSAPGLGHVVTRDPGSGSWSFLPPPIEPGPEFAARFLAVDGDFAALSYAFDFDDPPDPPLATYVYELLDGGGATLIDTIPIAPNVDVDIADGVLAIPSLATGNVELFELSSSGAAPVATLVTGLAPSATGDIALGGDIAGGDGFVAVTAPGDDDVYVFQQTPSGEWASTLVEVLGSPDGDGGVFGTSVAASAETLVIGELFNSTTAPSAGAAWAYDWTGSGFGSPQRLEASDVGNGNRFGIDVDVDGDVIVVGSDTARKPDTPIRDGAAYVFQRDGSTWSETRLLRAPDGLDRELFGGAVAVSGANVLVGANADANDNGVPTPSGAFFDAGGAAYWYAIELAIDPELAFDLDFAVGEDGITEVAPTGLDVALFEPSTVESSVAATSSLAATSIGAIQLEDTPLSAITIGSTPLSAIVLESVPLSAIPLVDIEIREGDGWDTLLDGTAFEEKPFANLTFGEVLEDQTVRGRVEALPLSAIDVGSTPLSAIPLSAIALGETPLSAIPLSAIDGTTSTELWCDIVVDLIPTGSTCALDDLTLTEITLRGVPLSAIPLSAIPLSEIDLSQSPLSAIPLSAIDLQQSPLSAIPLSAIPLSAIGTAASPLSAIPLSAIPLSAIPLSAIDLSQAPLSAIAPQGTPLSAIPLSAIGVDDTPLSAIPTSIPLSAIPLSAIAPDGTPLSAIELEYAPLSAIPLSAILLADTLLSAIPLSAIGTDWCTVLAEADAGFDCTTGVDPNTTTLRELSVRGVPLSAIPLSAIPLSAIPLSAIPLSAIPLSAIPLSAIPLSAIPLSAIPLSAIDPTGAPLSAIPLSAIDVAGSPLSAIPLSAIDLANTPLSAIPLSAIPLSAIPLSAIPLSAIDPAGTPLSAIPLSAIDVLGSPLSAIPLSAIPLSAIDCGLTDCDDDTLGEAIRSGAVDLAAIPLSAIQPALSGIRLGDLADAFLDFGFDELRAAVDALDPTITLGSLPDLDDLTLGDLPSTLDGVEDLLLGQLGAALAEVTFADLLAAIDDPAAEAELRAIIDGLTDASGAELTLGDLDSLGDVTVGDLLEGGTELTLADVEPLLGFVTVENLAAALGVDLVVPGTPLGDLSAEQLGQLTLADLVGEGIAELDQVIVTELLEQLGLAGLLEGFTLADLLLALVDPASLPFGGVDFEDVDVNALPAGTVAPVALNAELRLTANDARTVQLEVTIPPTAAFVAGSGTVTTTDGSLPPVEVQQDPVQNGTTLSWTIVAEPGLDYDVGFELLPAVQLGSSPITAAARIAGTDVNLPASVDITVAEGLEPNDFDLVDGARQTTSATEGVVYLTYVSSPTDQDVFELAVGENDRLVAELGNLDADLDLVLYGLAEPTGSPGSPLSDAGDQPPLIPITDPDADATGSEPLDDFVRLDELDPDLELVEIANGAGTVNEVLSSGRLPAGTYYLQVFGVNGATTVAPASLQVKNVEADTRPACAATPDLPDADAGTVPADFLDGTTDANTLILLNEQRTEQWYGAEAAEPGDEPGRAEVLAAIGRLTGYLADDPVGSQLGIDPIVVPVDGFDSVRQAYAAWDDDQCDPDLANAVVAAINEAAIDPLRDQLDHVVILGGDEVIPMARLLDATSIANEYDYRHEFTGDLAGGADGINSATSHFWESRYLSDEPYGESAARSLGDRFLYVSDVALGRVVETPADIVDALDTFVSFHGELDVSTAEVLGYDFLADGSAEIADTLVDELGAPNVELDAADGFVPDANGDQVAWDREYAEERLAAAATNALISLNAHFDHYRALPAIGDKVPAFDDNLVAANVRGLLGDDALAQSLIFSMGCHSGLSVSDVLVGTTNRDWAQEIAGLGALYVGNTGFGYGDTEIVAYTERLMSLFAERVTAPLALPLDGDVAPSTVGQALTYAKNDFVAGLQTFSVYDEKALQESTFYGLPFYRVGLAPDPLPAPPDNTTTPDATGTASLPVTITAANDENQTDRGTFFSNPDTDGEPQTIVSPGRPVQPVTDVDVSVVDPDDPTQLAQEARGALVVAMTSEWIELDDPVIATPIFDESAERAEPSFEGSFPAKPVTLNSATEPGGERQRLAVATGQYRSGDPGVQRLDERLDIVVYYADPDETDTAPPKIGVVDAEFADGLLTVDLAASDPSGVDRVYLLVAPDPLPGRTEVEWIGLDLTDAGGDRWTGSLALDPTVSEVELIVQAKDGVGNVAYATNKAQNFNDEVQPPAPIPIPPATQLAVEVDQTDLDPAGWYPAGPVTATVVSAATPASYSIDGGPFLPVGVGDSFAISGVGEVDWVVRTEGGRQVSGIVRIDDGNPTATLGSPLDGAEYRTGTGRIDAICRDVSPVTCSITLDGEPVANGTPLPVQPGEYAVAVTATDVLGNSADASATFTVFAVAGPPEITEVTGPTEPQPLADGVTIEATFTDPSTPFDTYTASVAWGDGTTSTSAAGEVTVVEPAVGTPGTLTADHVYDQPGVYVVTVEVTDGDGESDSEVYEFVVVYDPDESGRVTGSGYYWSGPEAHDGTPWWGSLASFGYRARYVDGEVVPSGATRLRLFGEFFFRSAQYDYLTVNDTMAVAEGTGTVNGGGDYRFRVQGIDNGWIDFFQITIWDQATGAVLYDNGILYDKGDLVLLGGIRVRE